jgi:hypothetical protein
MSCITMRHLYRECAFLSLPLSLRKLYNCRNFVMESHYARIMYKAASGFGAWMVGETPEDAVSNLS